MRAFPTRQNHVGSCYLLPTPCGQVGRKVAASCGSTLHPDTMGQRHLSAKHTPGERAASLEDAPVGGIYPSVYPSVYVYPSAERMVVNPHG